MAREPRKTVIVAGASGFVGRGLPAVLGGRYELVGLSRNPERAASRPGASAYQWRQSDLFSGVQTRRALEGADLAVYLVHSLHPSARLTQGEVGDLDLLCADNFAQAACHHGVDHIVHVSQMTPRRCHRAETKGAEREFLRSRREVEAMLSSRGTPVTTLRAAMVLGAGAPVVQMLERLVERLPVMVLPSWSESRLRPIARWDLVELVDAVLGDAKFAGERFDVAGRQVTTFYQMLTTVADLTGRRRRFVSISAAMRGVSIRWLRLWTGQPRWVVRALVDKLGDDLLPRDTRLQEEVGQCPMAPRQMLRKAVETVSERGDPRELADEEETTALVALPAPRQVRAVHRLEVPGGRDAMWIAEEYRRWLPSYFAPFIAVEVEDGDMMRFFLRPFPWPILELELDHGMSEEARQLYWIRGGLLVLPNEPARLEFRQVLEGHKALAAIHEFRPRLPWLIYLLTQARIHHLVMRAFDRHLRALGGSEE